MKTARVFFSEPFSSFITINLSKNLEEGDLKGSMIFIKRRPIIKWYYPTEKSQKMYKKRASFKRLFL